MCASVICHPVLPACSSLTCTICPHIFVLQNLFLEQIFPVTQSSDPVIRLPWKALLQNSLWGDKTDVIRPHAGHPHGRTHEWACEKRGLFWKAQAQCCRLPHTLAWAVTGHDHTLSHSISSSSPITAWEILLFQWDSSSLTTVFS